MPYKYDYENIRAQARGRWSQILATLAPAELEGAMEKVPQHVPCPIHGGRDGFRLYGDFQDNGGGVCNTCGAFPSGFRLLQWLKGWEFTQALAAVTEVLSGGLPDIRPVNGNGNGNGKGQDDGPIRQRLRQAWLNAVTLEDSRAKPARLYLGHRGISPATFHPVGLRCHPSLGYFEKGKGEVGRFPALLTLMCDPQGRAVTLHRTYLSPEGFKAPVEFPKKTMSYPSCMKLAEAIARLGRPENGTLGIAEGIETALAVREATGQVCWAATSAALLEAAVLPENIRKVAVWADNDLKKAGQKAALRLAERLIKESRKVEVHVPDRPAEKKSWDWADVLTHQGPGGFPRLGRFSRIRNMILGS